MIATIPLATGNKLNCFISARGMLAIVWHCVWLFCCCFFLLILHVNKSSSQKKKITTIKLEVLFTVITLKSILQFKYVYISSTIVNVYIDLAVASRTMCHVYITHFKYTPANSLKNK